MHRQTGPRPRVFVQVMQILHIGLTVQNWLKGNRERLRSACMFEKPSHGVHLHARCRTKISRELSGAPNTAVQCQHGRIGARESVRLFSTV